MKFVLTATLVAASFCANAACPDYNSVVQAPALSNPAKRSFNSFGNTLLSALYTPYHMAHDAIVREGSSATMVGKFDYDAVLHKDLEGEKVHVYLYGTGLSAWQYLGNFTTDSDGRISVPLGQRAVGEYVVRMIVEGDLSSTQGYLSVVDPGREAVLFDVDGTLTINDFEAYADYVGIKTATAYYYAVEMVNAYKQKGYQIIYLSGRPYWVTKDTREWFTIKGLNLWHYHSNPYGDGAIPPDTQQYKTDYLNYLRNTVGLDIVRVYGNAATDVAAYANSGLPTAETYIIGTNAGMDGTQPITGDYAYHYSTVVQSTPDSACRAPG